MSLLTDRDVETELKQNLSKDEKLLWTGRPKTGILFRGSDIFLIPFSLLWCGFAIFWETSVVSSGAPFFFMIWGIPFIAVGLYVTVGRFFIDAKKRSNTIYGITDNRVIIKSGIFSQEIKSLNIKTLSDLTISEKSDGTGTISFGPSDFRYAMMDGMEWPGMKRPPRLEFVPDVKKLYELLLQLQRQN